MRLLMGELCDGPYALDHKTRPPFVAMKKKSSIGPSGVLVSCYRLLLYLAGVPKDRNDEGWEGSKM